MPNIKSAKKRVLRTKKETAINNDVYTSMRTSIKKVEKASNKEEASAAFVTAMKKIDTAYAKGILKANTRDRNKKRLNKIVNEK